MNLRVVQIPVLATAAVGLTASFVSANVTINYSSSSQYTYKVSQVPDFDQKRSGTPNNGNMYCAPTSALNWAAYVSGHGYPSVSPPWKNWQLQANQPLASINQVAMGVVMGTSATGGTDLEGMMGGQNAWFGSGFIHYGVNASGASSPTYDTLANLALAGSLVMVRVGWYNTSNYPFITRTGGHITCLTRAVRSGSSRTLGINDPASDDGDITMQGIFSRENYPCQNENVIADGWPRTYTKMVGYGSGYIDGYRAILPLYGITNIPLTLNKLKIKKLSFLGNEAPTEFNLDLLGNAVLLSMDSNPINLLYMYKTGAGAPISNIHKLNTVTGESTPLVTEVGNITAMTTGRQGWLYFVKGLKVTCIDLDSNPQVLQSNSVPGPVDAMEYDDMHDEVVMFDKSNKKIYRLPKSLAGRPKVLPLPVGLEFPGTPVMAIHPKTGHAWIGSSQNAKIFEAYVDPDTGGAMTFPLLLPATVGPKSLQFDDDGLIYICDGSVKVYKNNGDGKANQLGPDDSPFAGLASDTFFRLPRSRNNFDPDEMLKPEQIETVLPTEFSLSVPDCKEDLNGDDKVDGADLGILLADWGTTEFSVADLNADGVVDGSDLGLLLAMWGACPN